MTKQEAKEQRRKAKKLARVLNGLPEKSFIYNNSLSVPGDGVMAVEISIDWNGKWYTASGADKCNRIDVWSEGLGVDIATGRALLRIAYQILKEESHPIQPSSIFDPLEKEVIEAITNEYGNVTGVIFVKKGPGPRVMFETPNQELEEAFWQTVKEKEEEIRTVPGSAKYRSVIQPEVIPTGLEVMKEKGMLNEQTPSGPSEG